MNTKDLQNRAFVRNLVVKGMSQTKAFQASRNRKTVKVSDPSQASRLVKKDHIQVLIRKMRQKYASDADRAYKKQWSLASKKTTPPHVKMGFYKEVQDRAGLGAIDLGIIEHRHQYEDLNLTKQQLIDIINEPLQLTDKGKTQIEGTVR